MGIRAMIMGLLGGTAAISALRRPFWGLLFVVFLYFWRPALWGGEAVVKPVEWATLGTAAGWLIRERANGRLGAALWFALFAAAYVLCTVAAPFADETSWASLSKILKILAFSFLITQLCGTPRRLATLLLVMLLGCLWIIKVVLLSWAATGFSGAVRIDTAVGQGGGANYIAWILASTLPWVLYKAAAGVSWERWVSIAAMPLWVASIIATGSRGGLLAVAASVVACLLLLRRLRILIIVVALAGILASIAPSEYWERINTITLDPGQMDVSTLIRYQNIWVALRMMGDHPLFGVGLDGFVKAKSHYVTDDYVGGNLITHNTYLQIGSELGAPFLAMFLFFNGWMVYKLVRVRGSAQGPADEDLNWTRVAVLCAIAATGVQMFKGDMAGNDYLWWIYAIGLAVMEVHRRSRSLSVDTATATGGARNNERSAQPGH